MPRWETKTAKKESFLELVLDQARLWVAAGQREPGATEWSVERNHPTCFSFNDGAEAARADYDKRIAKLPKAARLVGEATPAITPTRERANAERAELEESMRAWEAKHGLIAKLEAEGLVRLVGKKTTNRDEYYEVAIEGTTVVVRRGKLEGGRPKTEREDEPSRARALVAAQIKLMTSMGILGFGPP